MFNVNKISEYSLCFTKSDNEVITMNYDDSIIDHAVISTFEDLPTCLVTLHHSKLHIYSLNGFHYDTHLFSRGQHIWASKLGALVQIQTDECESTLCIVSHPLSLPSLVIQSSSSSSSNEDEFDARVNPPVTVNVHSQHFTTPTDLWVIEHASSITPFEGPLFSFAKGYLASRIDIDIDRYPQMDKTSIFSHGNFFGMMLLDYNVSQHHITGLLLTDTPRVIQPYSSSHSQLLEGASSLPIILPSMPLLLIHNGWMIMAAIDGRNVAIPAAWSVDQHQIRGLLTIPSSRGFDFLTHGRAESRYISECEIEMDMTASTIASCISVVKTACFNRSYQSASISKPLMTTLRGSICPSCYSTLIRAVRTLSLVLACSESTSIVDPLFAVLSLASEGCLIGTNCTCVLTTVLDSIGGQFTTDGLSLDTDVAKQLLGSVAAGQRCVVVGSQCCEMLDAAIKCADHIRRHPNTTVDTLHSLVSPHNLDELVQKYPSIVSPEAITTVSANNNPQNQGSSHVIKAVSTILNPSILPMIAHPLLLLPNSRSKLTDEDKEASLPKLRRMALLEQLQQRVGVGVGVAVLNCSTELDIRKDFVIPTIALSGRTPNGKRVTLDESGLLGRDRFLNWSSFHVGVSIGASYASPSSTSQSFSSHSQIDPLCTSLGTRLTSLMRISGNKDTSKSGATSATTSTSGMFGSSDSLLQHKHLLFEQHLPPSPSLVGGVLLGLGIAGWARAVPWGTLHGMLHHASRPLSMEDARMVDMGRCISAGETISIGALLGMSAAYLGRSDLAPPEIQSLISTHVPTLSFPLTSQPKMLTPLRQSAGMIAGGLLHLGSANRRTAVSLTSELTSWSGHWYHVAENGDLEPLGSALGGGGGGLALGVSPGFQPMPADFLLRDTRAMCAGGALGLVLAGRGSKDGSLPLPDLPVVQLLARCIRGDTDPLTRFPHRSAKFSGRINQPGASLLALATRSGPPPSMSAHAGRIASGSDVFSGPGGIGYLRTTAAGGGSHAAGIAPEDGCWRVLYDADGDADLKPVHIIHSSSSSSSSEEDNGLSSEPKEFKTGVCFKSSDVFFEGTVLDTESSGIGAIVALGLAFMSSSSQSILDVINTPDSATAVAAISPASAMTRAYSRALILAGDGNGTTDHSPMKWLFHVMGPSQYLWSVLERDASRSEGEYLPRGTDLAGCSSLFAAWLAGAISAVGVCFNEDSPAMVELLKAIVLLLLPALHTPGTSIDFSVLGSGIPTTRCEISDRMLSLLIASSLQSLSLLRCGTTDPSIVRLISLARVCRSGVTLPEAVFAEIGRHDLLDKDGRSPLGPGYGYHLLLHRALGLVCAGQGGLKLDLSDSSRAILAFSCVPNMMFLTPNDNSCALQATMHLPILALTQK
eukprot:gnl/Dysnectes_brevis/6640_a10469_208.p1 GENE.gnl/Dysnectes_brevis/6640_a10469_208~~gnl/Dysnectes_brevis/6640_a10469_208.p1  ORF type:complete len:1404 (+),score=117.98 gnl/Dysnectes_brevis/6640_a10469_208:64-4212(+)